MPFDFAAWRTCGGLNAFRARGPWAGFPGGVAGAFDRFHAGGAAGVGGVREEGGAEFDEGGIGGGVGSERDGS
jgi:hypothetical protein